MVADGASELGGFEYCSAVHWHIFVLVSCARQSQDAGVFGGFVCYMVAKRGFGYGCILVVEAAM